MSAGNLFSMLLVVCLLLISTLNLSYGSAKSVKAKKQSKANDITSDTLIPIVNAETRQLPDQQQCTRMVEFSQERRHCLKPCVVDEDCKSKRRKCLCDGTCGMSCVNPRRKCHPTWIENGQLVIEPFNKFGALAKYECYEKFHLSGPKERFCQGDGTWSDEEPRCDKSVKCGKPPVVRHAYHDEQPDKFNRYAVGTQLTYKCVDGYFKFGFPKAMCMPSGRWNGGRFMCAPRYCGDPGSIENANRKGSLFIYPNSVEYSCQTGYQLIGSAVRRCMQDGTWSGDLPLCSSISCPEVPIPAHGQIKGGGFYERNFGSVVTFECFHGYKLIGDAHRSCLLNGTWSLPAPHCKKIDCGPPEFLANGVIEGDNYVIGSHILFRCNDGASIDGFQLATCLENGSWSNPAPKCWMKCLEPSLNDVKMRIRKQPLELYEHGEQIEFSCVNPSLELSISSPAICVNGSWSHIPHCLPQPCRSRPPDLKNGLVRFFRMQSGDRARYVCNTGFRLIGDEYLTCSGGNWMGNSPECLKIFCSYPGDLANGTIYIVGVVGKYRYEPFITTMEQTDQIEYQCNEGYELSGYNRATCLDGQWHPAEKPKCIPVDSIGQHPVLPINWPVPGMLNSRFLKRDTAAQVVTNSTMPDYLHASVDKDLYEGSCEAIESDSAHSVDLVKSGLVPELSYSHQSVIQVTCLAGFRLVTMNNRAKCFWGHWLPKRPLCEPAPCELPLGQQQVQYLSYKGEPLDAVKETIASGHWVRVYCVNADSGQPTGERSTNVHCEAGKWIGEFPVCNPELRVKATVDPPDKLIIKENTIWCRNGTLLTLECWVEGPDAKAAVYWDWAPSEQHNITMTTRDRSRIELVVTEQNVQLTCRTKTPKLSRPILIVSVVDAPSYGGADES